jgi:hypothetical protein
VCNEIKQKKGVSLHWLKNCGGIFFVEASVLQQQATKYSGSGCVEISDFHLKMSSKSGETRSVCVGYNLSAMWPLWKDSLARAF